MRKNVGSQIIGVQMVSATDGSAFTGSVTVAVTGDAGTQATGSVGAGACTHEGNGFHTYAPAQAETNYNHVAFTFTGTGAVPVTVQVYTIGYDPHANLPANVKAVSDDTTAADTLELFAEAIDQSTGQLDSGSLANDTITAASIATGAIDADAIADNAIDAGAIASDAITAAKLASDVTTELQSGLATSAELAKVPKSDSNVTWNATAAAQIQSEANDALVANHLDHLLAATYDPSSKPGASDALLNELVENDGGVARFTENALEEAPTGGSAPTVEEIRAEIDSNSTQLAAIVEDTAEIGTAGAGLTNINLPNQTMDIVGNITGNLSGSVGSVTGGVGGNVTGSVGSLATQAKADVNAEVDTALGDYDAPTKAELDSGLAGLNDLSDAEVRTALGLATANLDTQLGDLPTSAELATALAGADDAVLAAIAALNNLSSAGAQSAAAAALTAYDPPTKAELDAGLLALQGADSDTLETLSDQLDGKAATGAAMTLTSGERDSIATALLDLANGVETSETVRQALRLIRAVLVGKSDGFPAGPAHFRDKADSKNRVTASIDSDGNRTVITTDAT